LDFILFKKKRPSTLNVIYRHNPEKKSSDGAANSTFGEIGKVFHLINVNLNWYFAYNYIHRDLFFVITFDHFHFNVYFDIFIMS